MRYLLLLLLPYLLFGAKILSYNVYERSNRVDIMITFDTPYEGKLAQIKKSNKIILKLEDASIEAPKIKNINTSYLHKMMITPINAHTEIILQTAADIAMSASKTSDSYGLRLRFTKDIPVVKQEKQTNIVKTTDTVAKPSDLITKKSGEFNNAYYVVIAVLLIGIFIMLWLKKKMGSPQAKSKQPWLFKGSAKKEGISVRFQKPLDPKNRVVMLDYDDQSYLVVIGTSNLLLDKYNNNKPVETQSDFERLLDENRTELDAYLQLDKSPDIEPLQSYKDKASGQIHELA